MHPQNHKAFTKGVLWECSFPEELQIAILLFTDIVEVAYCVPIDDCAGRKILSFFNSMYAFLFKCHDY
jgi:hypothetical protein